VNAGPVPGGEASSGSASSSAAPSAAVASAMTWRLHGEVVLLAGWGRAILLQLAHPLVARGVAEHSGFLGERRGRLARLHRTLSAMLTLTFGAPEEAERVARGINAIHDRVHGHIDGAPDACGRGPRYSAHDPALLAWVHATLVDSLLRAYELFVAPLTAAERDRYCAESSRIEPLLGIPAGMLPRTADQLASYIDGMLAGGEIVVTESARVLGREVVNPSGFGIGRPLLALARLPAVGLLPPAIRQAYGFAWTDRRERALVVLGAISRRVVPLLPSALRYWPVARAARARHWRARHLAARPAESVHSER